MKALICLLLLLSLHVVPDKHEEKTAKYEIDTTCPRVQSTPARASVDKVNRRLQSYVQRQIAQFKKEVAKRPPPEGSADMLSLSGEAHTISDRFVSVLFSNSEYTGGAHPSPYSESFLYDLRDGGEWKLRDLFRPGSGYLSFLSRYCAQQLRESLAENKDDQMIAVGTAPKLDNFKVFYLRPHTLVIVFPTYQVAPYVAGPQEVEVPEARLRGMLARGGPLR